MVQEVEFTRTCRFNSTSWTTGVP